MSSHSKTVGPMICPVFSKPGSGSGVGAASASRAHGMAISPATTSRREIMKLAIRFTQVNAAYGAGWGAEGARCCGHLSQADTYHHEFLLLSEHVRSTLGTRDHTVRMVVVFEALLYGIPVQLAFEHNVHVVDEARGAGAVSKLGGRDGLFAADDALQPVAVLLLAFVELDLVGTDDRLDDRAIAGGERGIVVELGHGIALGDLLVAARNENPALRSIELDPVGIVAADAHTHAVRIQRFSLEGTVHVPQAVFGELRGSPDFNGAGVLGVHPPMRAVDVVSAPSGNHARAELAAAQPSRSAVSLLRMDAINGVVDERCLPEPHLVIETVGNSHWRLVATRRVARQADLDALQIADASVAHQLRSIAELDRGTL